MKQFKAFGFETMEVKDALDGYGEIDGYASTFGNVDQGGDRVIQGAFKKTIKDKKGKFPILLDHDPTRPIGFSTEVSEDDKGLFMKMKIVLATEEARQRYALVKMAHEMKTNVGMSIGYSTINSRPNKENPAVRDLVELKLWENSLVTFPMNEKAGSTAAKFLEDPLTARLVEMLRKAGYSADEVNQALGLKGDDLPASGAAEDGTEPVGLEELCHSMAKLTAAIRS